MDNLEFRALELLKIEGIEAEDSFIFNHNSEFYPLIIETNNKKNLTYFFLIEDGELFYDGYSSDCCTAINEVCLN